MTLYASADDAALFWSGKFASGDRAGTVTEDGPVLVDGVESIDLTNANPCWWFFKCFCRIDFLGPNTHNTFVNDVIVDISRLVKTSEHPPDKRTSSIRGVPEGTPKPKYWRYTN